MLGGVTVLNVMGSPGSGKTALLEATGRALGATCVSPRCATITWRRPRRRSHIKAQVPIERMFGYSTELRSMSQGRAAFQMTFSHYDIA